MSIKFRFFILFMGFSFNLNIYAVTYSEALTAYRSHDEITLEKYILDPGSNIETKGTDFLSQCIEIDKNEDRLISLSQMLIKHGLIFENENLRGMTPLYRAVRYNLAQLSRLFLLNGANINVELGNHLTPMYWAILSENKDLIDLLLQYGSKIDFSNDKIAQSFDIVILGNKNITPEVEDLYIFLISEFLNIKEINSIINEKMNQNLLHIMIIRKCYKVAEFLINKGAATDIPDKAGRTAKYLIARSDSKALKENLSLNSSLERYDLTRGNVHLIIKRTLEKQNTICAVIDGSYLEKQKDAFSDERIWLTSDPNSIYSAGKFFDVRTIGNRSCIVLQGHDDFSLLSRYLLEDDEVKKGQQLYVYQLTHGDIYSASCCNDGKNYDIDTVLQIISKLLEKFHIYFNSESCYSGNLYQKLFQLSINKNYQLCYTVHSWPNQESMDMWGAITTIASFFFGGNHGGNLTSLIKSINKISIYPFPPYYNLNNPHEFDEENVSLIETYFNENIDSVRKIKDSCKKFQFIFNP